MRNIAVLGFGTVGSGVVEAISDTKIKSGACEDIYVKAILDIRKFPDSPYADRVTDNYDSIVEDDTIEVIAETMGGVKPAYEFTKRALLAGKSVVTSNKELVATHGKELLQIAKDNGVQYLFEASVGGGIPIIRPLCKCLAANKVKEIRGILNGTTNYILTQMIENNKSFEDALSDAQAKGYAEKDPSADIEGKDTCRKIAILSNIASGGFVDADKISTEGITKITLEDLKNAKELGYDVKLLGRCTVDGNKVYAEVAPSMLPKSNLMANVYDVFNAVLVNGELTGDVMFYGKGAGKLPTASAVVADIIEILNNKPEKKLIWNSEIEFLESSDEKSQYYVRCENENDAKIAEEKLGEVKYINKTSFITALLEKSELADIAKAVAIKILK